VGGGAQSRILAKIRGLIGCAKEKKEQGGYVKIERKEEGSKGIRMRSLRGLGRREGAG